jgi:hypothetical protein
VVSVGPAVPAAQKKPAVQVVQLADDVAPVTAP